MRICRDCKYFIRHHHPSGGKLPAMCDHPHTKKLNRVYGNWERLYCDNARAAKEACGPGGNLFEPTPPKRPSFIERLFA